MDTYNQLINKLEIRTEELYGTQYRLDSEEGNELQDMVEKLTRLRDICLSPEELIQKNSLLTKITAEMLRGYI